MSNAGSTRVTRFAILSSAKVNAAVRSVALGCVTIMVSRPLSGRKNEGHFRHTNVATRSVKFLRETRMVTNFSACAVESASKSNVV